MAMTLLIDDLKRMSAGPNALDPAVLVSMQRSLMDQVMYMYRDDYMALCRTLDAKGLPAEQKQAEKTALLTQLLQTEYRHRASNGSGFSLPQYVEAAGNYYRLEIQRLAQQLNDYVAQATHAATLNYSSSTTREVLDSDAKAKLLAEQVADRLDKLETAIERLGHVSRSEGPRRELEATLRRVFTDAAKDPFASAMLERASTIAAAAQYERRHGLTEPAALRLA